MNGRVEVATVLYLDLNLCAFRNAQGRTGNGAVVTQHPHGVVADLLGDRLNAHLKQLAVTERYDLSCAHGWEAGDIGREHVGAVRFAMGVVLHPQSPRTAVVGALMDGAACTARGAVT